LATDEWWGLGFAEQGGVRDLVKTSSDITFQHGLRLLADIAKDRLNRILA
jgi:hypothetical protein